MPTAPKLPVGKHRTGLVGNMATRTRCSTSWAAVRGRPRRRGSRSGPRDGGPADPGGCRARIAPRAGGRGRASRLGGVRRALSLSGDRRSAARDRGCGGRSGRGPPDGPADLRRCGLWQDRGGDARGLCRGHVGRAGGGDRAHDAAGAAALQGVRRAVPRLSGECAAPVALCQRGRGGQDPRGDGQGRGRYRGGHACASGQERAVQESRPA